MPALLEERRPGVRPRSRARAPRERPREKAEPRETHAKRGRERRRSRRDIRLMLGIGELEEAVKIDLRLGIATKVDYDGNATK